MESDEEETILDNLVEDDHGQHISFLLQPTTSKENGYQEQPAFDEVTNFVLDGENDQNRGYTSNDLISRTLHQLARDGNYKILELALDRLGEGSWVKKVNQLDQDHMAPLHYAARYAHPLTINTLLQRGAMINKKGSDDLTPLHCAARYRNALESAAKKRRHRMRLSRDENLAASDNDSSAPQSDVEDRDSEMEGEQEDEDEPDGDVPTSGLQEDRESVVKLLVENGADVSSVDIYGLTALHYAAMRGNDVAARDLLTYESIDIEAKDKQIMTPLFIAATYGYIDICRRLIEKGALLTCQDEIFQTPLHRAAAEGHLEICELLLKAASRKNDGRNKVKQLLNMRDSERQTALHVAVTNGHIKLTELLLRKGADVNAVRDTLATTLHAAAVVGNEELIRILIDNGANIEAVDSNQQTALHKAAANDQSEAITILLQNNANKEKRDRHSLTPFLMAASCGHMEALKVLMQYGAKVDSVDKDDRTGVFWCAKEGHVESLEVLLEDLKCVDLIDFSDRMDNSPLHEAAFYGNIDCLKLLLDKGSLIDNKNEDAETALHIASEEGKIDVVRELIHRFRFLMNDENEDANTPLHLASLKGHEEVVDLLLEAGADVEARNTKLWTPLDCASANGHEAVCQLLIDFDAPLDPLDKTKTTPLQLAAKNGHVEVTCLLMSCGASMEVVDSSSRNALQLAISNGKKDVAMAIVKSDQWMDALRNIRYKDANKITPFRELIVRFPDVAKAVLDRCITTNSYDPDDPSYGIRFNYEFLDDTYALLNKNDDTTSLSSHISHNKAFDEDGKLLDEAVPYTNDQRILKNNHPLMLMVKFRRSGLLGHPVVVSLVKQKWKHYARYIYYFNLIFYCIFLTFLTAYVVNGADWKYAQYVAINKNSTVDINDCKTLESAIGFSDQNSIFTSAGKWVIIIIAALHILREIFQFYQARLNYIGVENLLEWACYIGALLLVVDTTSDPNYPGCALRQIWQWQVGSVAIFLAWINLVLFLRKLPLFGIYVVMFTDVFMTFTRFFVVFFLFIIGFALSFYMIFRTQLPFETVWKSLLKTSVMMIGEFEFDSIFNNEDEPLSYPIVSYILFVGFLVMMSILIMNLLVGLAVDDIKWVQDQAVLKRRAMQTQLIMDVEVLIPETFRRKFALIEKRFYPHKKRQSITSLFSDFNLLYIFDYAEIYNKSDQQEQMDQRLDELSDQIKELRAQNQKMFNMFTATILLQQRKSKHETATRTNSK